MLLSAVEGLSEKVLWAGNVDRYVAGPTRIVVVLRNADVEDVVYRSFWTAPYCGFSMKALCCFVCERDVV